MTVPALSAGQLLLMRGLATKARVISKLGPLQGVLPRLEERGLVERFAPGRSPFRTMLRLTDTGRAALKPKD